MSSSQVRYMDSSGMEPYPEYKDSCIEWMGEIPESWAVKRLKYVTDILFSNVDKKSHEDEQKVVSCNYTDVYKNEYITENIDFLEITAKPNEITKFSIEKGDVIVTKDSETADDIGVPAYVNEDFKSVLCGYHLAIIRAHNLYKKYLFRIFQSTIGQYFEVCAKGVTRFGLGFDAFKSVYIPIPSSKEQQAIATFLDRETSRIDALVEKKQQFIELLEERRSALISHAVTKGLDPDVPMKDSGIEWIGEIPEHWDVTKLKFLAEIKTGEKDTIDNIENGKYPFFVRSPKIERINTYSFDGEAVLTAGDGVGVGKVFHYYQGKFDYHQRVYKISNFTNIVGRFFYYFMRENFHKEVIKISAKSTVDSLRLPMFLEFPVAFGTIKEQQAIADYLDRETSQIDTLIEKTEQSIEYLKEYRTALISSAVTGKIDVRGTVSD